MSLSCDSDDAKFVNYLTFEGRQLVQYHVRTREGVCRSRLLPQHGVSVRPTCVSFGILFPSTVASWSQLIKYSGDKADSHRYNQFSLCSVRSLHHSFAIFLSLTYRLCLPGKRIYGGSKTKGNSDEHSVVTDQALG